MTRLARGPRNGLNKLSAHEPLASNYYQHKIPVTKKQHAIIRRRKLFAASLGHDSPITLIDYNMAPPNLPWPPLNLLPNHCLHCFPGTTWNTKLYPQHYWEDLTQRVTQQNHTVLLPWGNPTELALADEH